MEYNLISMIHEYLLDRKVHNLIVNNSNDGLTDEDEMADNAWIKIVAPVSGPPITITTIRIWTPSNWDAINKSYIKGKPLILVKSSLIRASNFPRKYYEDLGLKVTDDVIYLTLDDPMSFSNLEHLLRNIIVEYNDFIKLMNDIGIDLLEDYLMWNDFALMSTKLYYSAPEDSVGDQSAAP